MHGKASDAIRKAFEAAHKRAFDDEVGEFISPDKEENSFWDLFDLYYDTESWIPSDTIEAAFCQGQKHPNKTRYSMWWGSAVIWFIGTEEEIVHRLENFQPTKMNDS